MISVITITLNRAAKGWLIGYPFQCGQYPILQRPFPGRKPLQIYSWEFPFALYRVNYAGNRRFHESAAKPVPAGDGG